MKKKPNLSFWQIWNMSFGFLGIQFGLALQTANVSRIFETLGANLDAIPILWIAAPVTGLLVQPIIGHWSDKTWGRLGRRRPFFLIGAILASLALIVMPNSPMLWVAAGMLWILDASINISMEPFRAFVGDMLPSDQRTKGFAMQSFFIGIGAVVGSLLPYVLTNWFNLPNTAPEGQIPITVKLSFYIGAVAFIGAVLWTVLRSKEYSPQELEAFNNAESKTEKFVEEEAESISTKRSKCIKAGLVLIVLGLLLTFGLSFTSAEKNVYILSIGLAFFGILEILAGLLQKSQKSQKAEGGLVSIINDLNSMPETMKQLAWVQFFSWFALFAMWIYSTNGITFEKYDMKLSANDISLLSPLITTADNAEIIVEFEKLNKEIEAGKTVVPSTERFAKYFLQDKIFAATELNSKLTENLELLANRADFEEIKKDIAALNDSQQADNNIETSTIKAYVEASETGVINFDPEFKTKFQLYYNLKHVVQEYNDGADWVGTCFGVYNGAAAVFAFFLMFLAKRTNRKTTHIIALIVGAISYFGVFVIHDPLLLLIPFVGIGMVWASILAMPYAILTGSLPAKKMGVYMGIFNFFIVIPQICAASVLGFLISELFDSHAIYAYMLGGISFIISALLVFRVKDAK